MAKVRRHTRVVNGRRQVVKAHRRRQLQPARARANARRAYRLSRRQHYGTAVTYGALAAGELAAWTTFRGASLVLITVGLAAVGLGVAARRATPSGHQTSRRRAPGTVRRQQPTRTRRPSYYEQGQRAGTADHRSSQGYDHSVPTPHFSENDPDGDEWNRGYREARGWAEDE